MKSLLKWLGRIAIGLLVLIAALLVLGFLYQNVSTANDAQRFPPPGQLVDVGGYRMHINCVGNAPTGTPTVIFEGGQANPSSSWAWIHPEIAKTTRACTYDRAGIAWSDDSANPRDAAHMAEELHTLLGKAGIAGPYILVGHSFGGLVTHVFAARYPSEVAGMVWLDIEHPDQWTRLPEQREQHASIMQMANLGRLVAPMGLVRLSNFFPRLNELPAQQADEFKAWTDTTRFMNINAAEFMGQDQSLVQAREAVPLGSMPLIVLTATDHGYDKAVSEKLEHAWLEMQNDLATLSTNSAHQVIAGTTHGSLQLNRQHAQKTIDAIRQLIENPST